MYFCVSVSLTLREVKLSVVSYLTNSIVDQILQELYATHKTLVIKKTISLSIRLFILSMCTRIALPHASVRHHSSGRFHR